MRTTVVPAQVTTVEDKIAGNLTFTQLLLLTTPIFISGAIFAFIPPFMSLKSYKLVICGVIAFVCMTLAIRIRGKLLLSWISLIARYNVRPRYYLFNKNDSYLRENIDIKSDHTDPFVAPLTNTDIAIDTVIPPSELMRLQNALADPRANFQLMVSRKGALRVYIQEIK